MLIEYNGKKPEVSGKAFVAPNATLIGNVQVAENASVWFGAQLRGDLGKIVVGARSSVQDNVVIHADVGGVATIEEDVIIGHGAVLHGCTIKKGAVIGINAVVLDKAVVGEQAMVAAGSVVMPGMRISPRYLASGIPARVKKEIAGDALWWVEQGGAAYIELARSYLQQGIGNVGSEEGT